MSTKEYLRSINATTRQSNMRIEGHKKELSRIRILESKKLPMPSNSQIKLKSEKITSEFSNY